MNIDPRDVAKHLSPKDDPVHSLWKLHRLNAMVNWGCPSFIAWVIILEYGRWLFGSGEKLEFHDMVISGVTIFIPNPIGQAILAPVILFFFYAIVPLMAMHTGVSIARDKFQKAVDAAMLPHYSTASR